MVSAPSRMTAEGDTHERIRKGRASRGARAEQASFLFWQPLPSRGYIVNKLTPYNTPHDSFSLSIQVLELARIVRRHADERQHEVLFRYAGEGWAEVDGQRRNAGLPHIVRWPSTSAQPSPA